MIERIDRSGSPECAHKRDVRVYDYTDDEVPVLARMAARRRAGYRALGYDIG
jgi:hypothetical protein